MKKRFGIGDQIPEIQEEDIPKLAHYADKEANPALSRSGADERGRTGDHSIICIKLELEAGTIQRRSKGGHSHDGTGN